MTQTVKEAFVQELNQPDAEIDLAKAALLLAQYLTRPFDLTIYLTTLDEIAESVRVEVEAATTDLDKLNALNAHLFDELGFLGNINNYYHPGNSFLNRVLELKKGIPISLSVLYLEVGHRLNLPLWGIGMPRHFIVGYGTIDDPIYIDVFDQGHFLDEDECLIISHTDPANRDTFRERFLRPVTKRSILYRMLQNLKGIYLGRQAWSQAYKTVDLALMTYPGQHNELRDRGLLAYRLNRLQDAVLDINRYLFLVPKNDNAGWLEGLVERMEEQLLRLN